MTTNAAMQRGQRSRFAPRGPYSHQEATLPQFNRWLIRRYRESSAWESLAPATRDQRENIFRHVERQAGDVPFKAITRKATPNQANNFIKSMRGLFSWAVDMEHVAVDPTRDVKLLTVKTDGFHVWTDDEVAQFEAHWPIGTRERLAFDLLLYTGLRRGDAVRLGRQHVKAGVFKITTEKNSVIVEAPILAPLARSIEARQATLHSSSATAASR